LIYTTFYPIFINYVLKINQTLIEEWLVYVALKYKSFNDFLFFNIKMQYQMYSALIEMFHDSRIS
jgi:hypothetical protein